MKKLEQERVEIFVEIGPGKVLTGLLKKILPREYPGEIFNVHDLKSMEIFLKRCA
jgi:[acyl-carrier-protein] S-malonyltransferase